MMLEGTGLKGGVDIMAGPPGERSLELPPLDELTPERIASLQRQTEQTHLEQGEGAAEEGKEDEAVAGGAGAEWDEDEWDEGLAAMGGPDPLGDVGWDVAERFEVLIAEVLATPAPEMFHSIGAWMGGGGLAWG